MSVHDLAFLALSCRRDKLDDCQISKKCPKLTILIVKKSCCLTGIVCPGSSMMDGGEQLSTSDCQVCYIRHASFVLSFDLFVRSIVAATTT